MLHVWNILPTLSIIILQNWVIFRANVGKYSSTMEPWHRHRLPGRGALPQRGRQTATELQSVGRHGACIEGSELAGETTKKG